MKTAGIITFHDALNYGAVLQAFALQDYILSVGGLNVEIIDYVPPYRVKFARQKFHSKNPIKKLAGTLIELPHLASFRRRELRFRDFVNNYHRLSQHKFADFEDFEYGCNTYDIIITGSDQVFNPKCDSNVYYLAFDRFKGKRIAYAPSMGRGKLSDAEERMIKPWLEKFEVLSCRENEGASILSRLTGIDVPVVCDPVCLISKERWHEIAVSPSKKGYIFVFDLNGGENLFLLAHKLSRQTGLPIEYATLKGIHPYIKNCSTHHDLGPREWLGYIEAADYVVTDSFHGTMLSLIMGTPIINKIAVESTSSRLTSLMKRLNISNQLITDSDSFDIERINFHDYKAELAEFIAESQNFLSTSLESGQE